MAGLGRKTWTNEVLSQPDLQGYLQDQVVAVFANTAARSAAIPAPSEGMQSYQLDTHRPEFYNGAAWVPSQYGQVRGKMWRTAGFSGAMTTGTEYLVAMEQSRVSGGFTFDDASDALNLPYDGLYDLEFRGYVSGAATSVGITGVRRVRASVANTLVGFGSWSKAATTQDHMEPFTASGVPLKAADKLGLTVTPLTNSGGTLTYYGGTEILGSHLVATYVGPLAGATPV